MNNKMKELIFFLQAYIEKTRYYSAERSQRLVWIGLTVAEAKRLSVFLSLIAIAWIIKTTKAIVVKDSRGNIQEECDYLFLDDISLGCTRGVGLVSGATGIDQQSINYYRCDYAKGSRVDIQGGLFKGYSALIRRVLHGHIRTVILFEGDKPEQVLIGALQRVWGQETVWIQWGAYIYAQLTMAQKSLPFTRLYIKNNYYRKRIEELGVRVCGNTEVRVGSYESIQLDKESKANGLIYFVGQPVRLDGCVDKRYSRGREVPYIGYIQKAQKIASDSGKKVRYIPHPKEFARIEELKSKGLELSEIGIENTVFSPVDVVIGCYSSLLVDLTLAGVNVVLVCESYEGTIFEDLIESGSVMLAKDEQ